ncbi:MAG: 4Fe-4S binding protein [Bacillota bacterium]
MCEYCEKYGEGDLWYLNPRNYSKRMYLRPEVGKKHVPDAISYRKYRDGLFDEYWAIRDKDPKRAEEIFQEINNLYRKNEPCQVLPLKDCLKVVEIAQPLAAVSCICRRMMRAIDERNEHEYSCLGLGVGMLKWERWPERYKGGVHFLSVEEAKEWLIKWDKRGLMHCIMVYGSTEQGTPFIGGICNCDYPDCEPIRRRLDYGLTYNLLKSHYVAIVNYDQCTGCGICVQRCQYGALKMEVTMHKPNIDMLRCFGCGLCETGCPKGAIELVERVKIPALKEAW